MVLEILGRQNELISNKERRVALHFAKYVHIVPQLRFR